MKKKSMTIFLFLSYLSLILSFIVLYATSVLEENGTVTFRSSAILTTWVFLALFLLLFLGYLVFSLVSYFRKRKTYPEEKEVPSEHLSSFSYQIKEYTPYLLLSTYRNRKDLTLLGFHALFLPLYSLILYFQKGMEKHLFYFYLIFLFGMLLLLFFLLLLFLIPWMEKRKKKGITYEAEIYSDKLLVREGEKEKILYDASFSFGREWKHYYLLITRTGDSVILPKEKMNKESEERISLLIRHLKEGKLTIAKKH